MLILISSLFLASSVAGNSTPQQVGQTEAPVVKPVKEKKICRTNKEQTGTRMPARTCHTAAEWQALEGGPDNVDMSKIGSGTHR